MDNKLKFNNKYEMTEIKEEIQGKIDVMARLKEAELKLAGHKMGAASSNINSRASGGFGDQIMLVNQNTGNDLSKII